MPRRIADFGRGCTSNAQWKGLRKALCLATIPNEGFFFIVDVLQVTHNLLVRDFSALIMNRVQFIYYLGGTCS